jgi:DNA-directed RNA polymerase sigma subunit (sigma70/sigma32)
VAPSIHPLRLRAIGLTLLQEITEDPNVEPPELSVERLMMKQQIRDFLGILSHREKEIIEHRFGVHDGEPKTLHVIGDMYGCQRRGSDRSRTRH